MEHIQVISHAVVSLNNLNTDPYTSDDEADDCVIELALSSSSENRNLCAVCLRLRETCLFIPVILKVGRRAPQGALKGFWGAL